MRIKKRFTYLCLLIPICAFSQSDQYKNIKANIDSLENSIIQDFSIDFQGDTKVNDNNQIKAARQVEVKYGIQKKLFYKIDYELSKIGSHVLHKQRAGLLTPQESERLKNSVNYAQRIILKSRVAEINSIYHEFKSKLTHKPKLTEIYDSFNTEKINNCSLHNLALKDNGKTISFEIQHKNNVGTHEASNFTITNEDVRKGFLTSKLDAYNKFKPFPNVVTTFNSFLSQGEGSQSFNLIQDENGKITEADFTYQKEVPLFSLFGIKFGNKSITKFFNCNKAKKLLGPKPASE